MVWGLYVRHDNSWERYHYLPTIHSGSGTNICTWYDEEGA